MGVADGQPVDSATVNPAFLDANDDDAALGILDLQNVEAISGPAVFNIQREHNSIASFAGKSTGTVFNSLPSWTNVDVGSGTDNLKARIEALTAAFNDTLGHTHDGTTGSGGPISLASLTPPLMGYFQQGVDLSSVTGGSHDVTANLTGASVSTGAAQLGVVVNTPYNKVILRQATGPETDDEFVDGSGNEVYARVTESAGTWTLDFYVDLAGVETPYSFPGSVDVRWYYQELFNPLVSTPVYDPAAFVPSENTTQDVVDASAVQRGVISVGAQSFAGEKTFTGNVAVDLDLRASGIASGDRPKGTINDYDYSLELNSEFGATGVYPYIGFRTEAGSGVAEAWIGIFAGLYDIATPNDSDKVIQIQTGSTSLAAAGGNILLRSGLGTSQRGDIVLEGNTVQVSGSRVENMADPINAQDGATRQFVLDEVGAIDFDSLAPTTTKGDIIAHNGTTNVRLPVGANGLVLTADSAEATGLKWVAGSGGGFSTPTTDSSFGNSVFNPGMTGTANTAVAPRSLDALTTGSRNSGYGPDSGSAITTGSDNVAIGYRALRFYVAPDGVTAIGTEAMENATAGAKLTAVGYRALRANTGTVNTAFGYLALQSNTTGDANCALGHEALAANLSGSFNLAVGGNALLSSVTGNDNVAIGINALAFANGGSFNTAVGRNAGINMTNGSSNTFIGWATATGLSSQGNNTAIGAQAMQTKSGGSNCTAIGLSAMSGGAADSSVAIGREAMFAGGASLSIAVGSGSLQAATSGTNNVAIGIQALGSFVAPSNQTAIGYQAMSASTGGTAQTAVGYLALQLSNGNNNTALGNSALRLNVTGADNTAIGRAALEQATGSNNTAVGNAAGSGLLGGVENTMVGTRSGDGMTSGNDNTVIGHQADGGTTGSNNIVIGAISGNTITSGSRNILLGVLCEPSSATATEELVLGSNFANITNAYIGQNPRAAGAAISSTTTVQPGGNPTGTDLSAAARIFRAAGARGTGTGIGGDFRIATAPAGATGSALNALVDRVFVKHDGRVGLGGDPDAFGALDIQSTTGALILPRMTTAERNALTAVNGMMIYNTTDAKFQGYEAGAWANLI